MFIVGGSIPEKENVYYNTSTVWNPEELIAKHRKVHLLDIDIPGRIHFKESETLTAGNQLTTFDMLLFRFGIGICYDLRFEDIARLTKKKVVMFFCTLEF